MIHRVKQCFGLPIWKWGKYIELWVCFSGVGPHTHPGQASEIVPLFGWAVFERYDPEMNPERVNISPSNWFHAFTVPSGWVHWFHTKFLVFLNVSDRSAATNLVYHNPHLQ